MKLIHVEKWNKVDNERMLKTYKLIGDSKNPAKGITMRQFKIAFKKHLNEVSMTQERERTEAFQMFVDYFVNTGKDLVFVRNFFLFQKSAILKKNWDREIDQIGLILGPAFNKFFLKNHFKVMDKDNDNQVEPQEFNETFRKYFQNRED